MTENNTLLRYDVDQYLDSDSLERWDGTPPGISARCLYHRAHEASVRGDIGQDFIALRANPAHSLLTFAVCDGVGASFLGHLAAAFLGTRLADWLANPDRRLATAGHELWYQLRHWTQEGQLHVQNASLPPNLPPLLSAVLDEKKRYGSETVFCAGRIAISPHRTLPTLWLCWMGNVRARIFAPNNTEIPIHPTRIGPPAPRDLWDDHNRWSTTAGPKGSLNIWLVPPHLSIDRIVIYSDGLHAVPEHRLIELLDQPDPLRQAILTLQSRSDSDDIALLEIRAISPTAAPALPIAATIRQPLATLDTRRRDDPLPAPPTGPSPHPQPAIYPPGSTVPATTLILAIAISLLIIAAILVAVKLPSP
jgi:hypothetical protein